MTKLTNLIKEMENTGKDSIHVNEAAEIMKNSADSAGAMINGCGRFERISKGTYKLLPKNTETEQTLGGRVQGVKVDKILAFMAKHGKTEIMLKDAADLTTSTTNNIYNQLMTDDRLVKTGRGRFGLASEHKPEPAHKPISALIPKPNNDPDELSLDEKIAKAKSDRFKALPNGAYTEQQHKPEESIPAQGDTTAPEPKDPRAEQHNEKLLTAFNEQSGKILTQIDEIAGLREENERLIDRLTDGEPTLTAQSAPEPRKVIRLCLCPHCGKPIEVD